MALRWLVMGYTAHSGDEIQEGYIKQFNAMEKEIL